MEINCKSPFPTSETFIPHLAGHVGNEHILQRFLCLEVTLLNLTASFFLHHWAITKFPSAPVCIWKAMTSTGTCARDSDWNKRCHLRVLMIFFFFIVVESCDSSPISRDPALSLLIIIIIFLCLKKTWIIWVIQMFTKTDSNIPAIEDCRLKKTVTRQHFPKVFNEISELSLEKWQASSELNFEPFCGIPQFFKDLVSLDCAFLHSAVL